MSSSSTHTADWHRHSLRTDLMLQIKDHLTLGMPEVQIISTVLELSAMLCAQSGVHLSEFEQHKLRRISTDYFNTVFNRCVQEHHEQGVKEPVGG